MDVTPISSSKLKRFVDKIATDYPAFSFTVGQEDHWSPKTKTITYNPAEPEQKLKYGLLHELAHATLGHTNYTSDFELLKLESEAWELASKIGRKYSVNIDEEHIQNCLDTYRDWLHRRSACPTCGMHTVQSGSKNYHCFNCQTSWEVSSGRFVRAYRKTFKTKTTQ